MLWISLFYEIIYNSVEMLISLCINEVHSLTRKERTKKGKSKKYLFFVIPFVVIIGLVLGLYYYINGKIYVPSPKDFFTSEEQKEAAQYEEEHGIINILLVGLDGRDKEEDSRTDSIILATLDTNNRRVKLTSFMRDMYVPIPGHKDNRINSAFFMGGPELLMQTLNSDFGLNIQYYASIDFRAFQKLVDTFDGVEVEVKDYEIKEINKYIKEVNGSKSTIIETPGVQKLNGQQALSYCRIRKVGNNDFERTERQRRVLGELIKKARKISVVKLPELFSSIIPYVKTNIQTTKLMNIGYTAYKFGNSPVDSLRIPYDGTFEGADVYGMKVLVGDLEKNASIIDKFMFSGSGSIASNMPSYMANNFHANDKPIDNRGQVKNIPKIDIPKEAETVVPAGDEWEIDTDTSNQGSNNSNTSGQQGEDQQNNNGNSGENTNNSGDTNQNNNGGDNTGDTNQGTDNGGQSGSGNGDTTQPPSDGSGANTTTP